MEIINRRTAADRGLKKYWTGVRCSKGHLDFRYTTTGTCVICSAAYNKSYRPAAPGTERVVFPVVPKQHIAEFQERAAAILHELNTRPSGEVPARVCVGMNEFAQFESARLPNGTYVTITPGYIAEYGDPIIEDGTIIGHLPPELDADQVAAKALGLA